MTKFKKGEKYLTTRGLESVKSEFKEIRIMELHEQDSLRRVGIDTYVMQKVPHITPPDFDSTPPDFDSDPILFQKKRLMIEFWECLEGDE